MMAMRIAKPRGRGTGGAGSRGSVEVQRMRFGIGFGGSTGGFVSRVRSRLRWRKPSSQLNNRLAEGRENQSPANHPRLRSPTSDALAIRIRRRAESCSIGLGIW